MSDFKDDLRSYIDGLEEPVSVRETMDRPQDRRRFSAPVAVFAGAAIVLVPALVLAGLRMLPNEDGDVADVAPAISRTTTTVTTSAAARAVEVAVPDVVGLPAEEGQAVLDDIGLDWTVVIGPFDAALNGRINAQDPSPGETVAAGSVIVIQVPQTPQCRDWEQIDQQEPGPNESAASLWFGCANDDAAPGHWVPTTRVVDAETPPIPGMLSALLAGPTAAEQDAGLGSFFSSTSADALNAVTLEPDRMIVDFNDSIVINNANTSTGRMFFLAELQQNLFQFDEVAAIEFRLNGSCDAFWNWLQGDCQVLTREAWDQQVEAWALGQQTDDSPRGEVDEITPSRATASALLSEAFSSSNLIDGDTETTWQAAADDALILEFRWPEPVQINYIEIYNISDEAEFRRNYRVQGYTITVDDLEGVEYRNTLSDLPGGPQRIEVASIETQVLTIEVLSTYSASAVDDNPPFDEIAVAEVRFFGSGSPQ